LEIISLVIGNEKLRGIPVSASECVLQGATAIPPFVAVFSVDPFNATSTTPPQEGDRAHRGTEPADAIAASTG